MLKLKIISIMVKNILKLKFGQANARGLKFSRLANFALGGFPPAPKKTQQGVRLKNSKNAPKKSPRVCEKNRD